MDWMQIQDHIGEPISANGIYQRFLEVSSANTKAHFMRDYRLLPYSDGAAISVCDDAREFDAMRDVMETCARLAAIAGGMGDGERKAAISDLEFVPGFERVNGGAFLHVNLQNSYWYKRFLYDALQCEHVPGDAVYPPISRRTLIDDETAGQDMEQRSDYATVARHTLDAGTFQYAQTACGINLDSLTEQERTIYEPSLTNDVTKRLAFRSFSPVPDLRFPADSGIAASADDSACFWSDSELLIRAAGENLRGVAGDMAHTLLLMHTGSTWHNFSFSDGFSLAAPMGVCALWADFAQDVAKRPICICKTCGRPVVETHAPRGKPRVYCSDACRMKDKRREKKLAQEQAKQSPA